MSRRRDPVQQRDDGSLDLQNVVEWEPRSLVDRGIYQLYGLLAIAARGLLVIGALFILLAQFALGGLGALADPVVGVFVVLSAVPAMVLAGYIWYADVTPSEPFRLLVVTFGLGLLFAGFAGVLNTLLAPRLATVLVGFNASRSVILATIFLFVVAPVEESVKLLAVRLYAYRQPQFDAVVVGAVYGGVAGLGFATIENAVYITGVVDGVGTTVLDGSSIATLRALAGPGHVIYSAFAGYYLGLARFNRRYAGPIVLKGLLVASLIHGVYNVLVSHVPAYVTDVFGYSQFGAFFTFVIIYNGFFVLLLVFKLSEYRNVYEQTHEETQITSERTEFDP
jgi:RsiW-degrading membrane proteinase PrsW (M82 family)